MKRVYEKPIMMVERFELDQHIAAACITPVRIETKEILGCMHPSHLDGSSHTWDVSDINPFTSELTSCVTKWDTRDQIVAYGKKMGGDANSWGSDKHGPALNGVSIDELFNSY